MIEYFTPGSTMTKFEAYMHGTGVVAMAAVYTFTHHPYFFGVMHTGMKIRIASCSLLYRKVKNNLCCLVSYSVFDRHLSFPTAPWVRPQLVRWSTYSPTMSIGSTSRFSSITIFGLDLYS